MKINEEIYRSIIAPKEESDRNIVPLEEVLLIDEAAMRRDLIMNVLNDDPENYIDMLKQARMNDDVEVVHYAITGMVELSKEYESRLQKIEYRYAKEPENQQLISEYCDFLQEYLSQGLLEGQMELVQRNQYIKLLKKKLKFKEDLHTYVCLAENQMQTKEYEQVLKSLERMDKKWHRNEEYWILRIRYYVELKQGKELKETETLSSTAARQNIISQLIQAAKDVGMDGINVDFESLSEDVGIHFLEFLRELSIECHKNNLVLSVDNPVPEDFTSHYDRAEQGRVVDYVIIMGYDEHYVGSEAGSVASLPWVEQGIQDTLDEVPAERVINAIPFYTRLWKTTGGNVTSEAIGMDQAQQTIADNNVETYWDKTTSQNYGKYDIDNSTYQIWLEDAQSVAQKVKLVSKYDLAGVSAWKLGFENNGIWQVISDNLNN